MFSSRAASQLLNDPQFRRGAGDMLSVVPGIAAWGRRATVQLDGGSDVLPGQAFSVSLD